MVHQGYIHNNSNPEQASMQRKHTNITSRCSLIILDKLSDASPPAIAAKGICTNTSQPISQQAALTGDVTNCLSDETPDVLSQSYKAPRLAMSNE